MFVCASVCLSVRTKSQKLLFGNCCNLVGICPMVNAGYRWKLVAFHLQSYFGIFVIQAIPFLWLYLATSFLSVEIRLQNIYATVQF